MKPSDDLFELIKSLTKSEKRYFKIITTKKDSASQKNNYLKLFDEIEKQKIYDEKKIVAKFSDSSFVKHLPSEKNYLYTLILKSLNLYHFTSSKGASMDELLHFTEILYSKGLYNQSRKVAGKARDVALKEGLYYQMVGLSKLRLALAVQLAVSSEQLKAEEEDIFFNLKSAVSNIANESKYMELKGQFLFLIRREGELVRKPSEMQKFDLIINNPLMNDEKKALTYESKNIFYFIRSVYHHVIGDFQKAYFFNKKALEFIESHPEKITQQSDYTAKINNICETCLRIKKYDEFRMYLDKLQDTPAASTLDKSRKFYRYYELLLRMYVQTGEFNKGISLAPEIQEGMKLYEKHIHKSRVISLHYHFAYAYFGSGDHKNALVWINKILNDKTTDLRKDLLCFARILNFFIHFELHNNLLFEHILKSTRHFLYTKEKIYKLESIVLDLLRKLPKLTNESKTFDLLNDFKEELSHLQKDPFERLAFEYFDLLSWVESKLEGKKFSEVARSKISK